MILPFANKTPSISGNSFIAPDSVIIGDVTIDEESSIWFKAVLRGDINWIKIGKWTNIQDGCIIHVTGEKSPTTVGSYVTVGHGAILHGCTIEDSCLIGMGAIILDNAVIGNGSLIAAGAMVKSGTIIPPQSMVAGNPAIIKRRISNDEKEYFKEWALHYRETSKGYCL